MEPIRIKSKTDFSDYCKITYKKHYSAGNMLLLLTLFSVLQIFVFDPKFNLMDELIVVGVVVFFYGLLIPLVLYVSCKRDMKRPVMQETLNYTIDEAKIDLKGETTSTVAKWPNIKKAVESDNYFVLFTNTRDMHYLPKGGFASNGDIDQFRQIIKMNKVKAFLK